MTTGYLDVMNMMTGTMTAKKTGATTSFTTNTAAITDYWGMGLS